MLKQHYHAQEQKRLTSSKSCLLSISVHKKFTGIQSKYIEGLGKKKKEYHQVKREKWKIILLHWSYPVEKTCALPDTMKLSAW